MADPLKHRRVPPHKILTKAQGRMVMKNNHVADIETLPKIRYSDAVLLRMREEGQAMEVGDIVQIEREDLVAGTALTWRVIIDE